jgi:hypothetical protein
VVWVRVTPFDLKTGLLSTVKAMVSEAVPALLPAAMVVV